VALVTFTCADSVTAAHLPAGMDVYLAYADGSYENVVAVRARFPDSPVLTIAVTPADDADMLDVERYDAVPGDAPGWVTRQLARHAYRPVVYSSQSEMPVVIAALTAAGISRDDVRLISAHYGRGEHICSPTACDARFVADGTQWSTSPPNPGYDLSVLDDNFFAPTPPPAPAPVPLPAPALEDDMLTYLVDEKGEVWHLPNDDTPAVHIGPALWGSAEPLVHAGAARLVPGITQAQILAYNAARA
jgi:hypothetical protein